MVIDQISGLITWTPTAIQSGVHNIRVEVADLGGLIAEQSFSISVTDVNQPPFFISGLDVSTELIADQLYSSFVAGSDLEDGTNLTYSLESGPSGLTLDTVTGDVLWTPTISQDGLHDVVIRVIDSLGLFEEFTFELEVIVINNPPVINNTTLFGASVGTQASAQINVSDPDVDDIHIYEITGAHPDSNIAISETGRVTWTPLPVEVGLNSFTITVTDRAGLQDSKTFDVNLSSSGRRATFVTFPTQLVLAPGEEFVYDMEALTTQSVDVLFTLDAAPAGMTITDTGEDTARINWTPTAADEGENLVTIRARSAGGPISTIFSFQSFNIIVAEANLPPEITSIPPVVGNVGIQYVYNVVATDPNVLASNNVLTLFLISGPDGMTLDTNTNTLTWTPTEIQFGNSQVEIRVFDSQGASYVQEFGVLVGGAPANNLPTITSTPRQFLRLGFNYDYDVDATDPDGDTLTYSLVDFPAGMTIDGSTGEIFWYPDTEDTEVIKVRAEDGKGGVAEQAYNIIITGPSNPLTLEIDVTPGIVDPGDAVDITVIPSGVVGTKITSLLVNGSPVALDVNDEAQVIAPATFGEQIIEARLQDDYQTVNVFGSYIVRDPSDVTPPVVDILRVDNNQEVTAPEFIYANVIDENLLEWTLSVVEVGSFANNPATTILATGSNELNDQVAGSFDPTLLTNGLYEVTLEAVDLNGQVATDMVSLRVDGEMKVGNFTITFVDLSIPVSGVPITVTVLMTQGLETKT